MMKKKQNNEKIKQIICVEFMLRGRYSLRRKKYELNNIIVEFRQILSNLPRRRLTEQYSPYERLSVRC